MTLPAAFHVAIILDRSGSMASIRDAALGTVNGYFANLRADEGMAGALITLTIFDSESIDVIRDGVPITTCAALTPAEYEPRGLTPLYDAIGATVAALEKRGHATDRRALVIVTDGHENASRRFTRASILELISRRQSEGWLVAYLGAHADTWKEAGAIGIDHGSTAMVELSEAHVVASGLHALSARYLDLGAAVFTDDEREALSAAQTHTVGSNSNDADIAEVATSHKEANDFGPPHHGDSTNDIPEATTEAPRPVQSSASSQVPRRAICDLAIECAGSLRVTGKLSEEYRDDC